MINILAGSCGRQTFKTIRNSLKVTQHEAEAEKKAKLFFERKNHDRFKAIFYWLKRQAVGHNQGFARMIHI